MTADTPMIHAYPWYTTGHKLAQHAFAASTDVVAGTPSPCVRAWVMPPHRTWVIAHTIEAGATDSWGDITVRVDASFFSSRFSGICFLLGFFFIENWIIQFFSICVRSFIQHLTVLWRQLFFSRFLGIRFYWFCQIRIIN